MIFEGSPFNSFSFFAPLSRARTALLARRRLRASTSTAATVCPAIRRQAAMLVPIRPTPTSPAGVSLGSQSFLRLRRACERSCIPTPYSLLPTPYSRISLFSIRCSLGEHRRPSRKRLPLFRNGDQQRAQEDHDSADDSDERQLFAQPDGRDGDAEERDQVIRKSGLDGVEVLQGFQKQDHGEVIVKKRQQRKPDPGPEREVGNG